MVHGFWIVLSLLCTPTRTATDSNIDNETNTALNLDEVVPGASALITISTPVQSPLQSPVLSPVHSPVNSPHLIIPSGNIHELRYPKKGGGATKECKRGVDSKQKIMDYVLLKIGATQP